MAHLPVGWGARTYKLSVEAGWPSGLGRWISMRSPLVQIPLWPVADVLGSPWLNFSVNLVNSQLVCLKPVGILNAFLLFVSVTFPEKPL